MELYALHKDFAVSYLEAIENATLEEQAAAFDRFGNDPLPGIITRTEGSDTAVITITGPLSPKGPNPIARFFGFGGTGYNDIIASAESLENDPSIETVRMVMDTVGGTVAGMDQARQALDKLATKKTLIAENHGVIASAGYYLATSAKSIEAMSPLVMTGEIGVVIAGLDDTDALARSGRKRIKIISKNAPNKQADPTTSQGRNVLQNQADAIERVFIQVAAKGRNTTEQDVIENFGQGGMLIAQDPDPEKPSALKAGMIDSVVSQSDTPVVNDDDPDDEINASNNSGIISEDNGILETQAANGGEQERNSMDLSTLKTEHPALYAQAISLGSEAGVKQERERVEAHLTMGKASGDMKLAVSCISDGADFTPAVNAKYMAASLDKKATAARQDESEGDLETEGSESTAAADEHDDAVSDAAAKLLGVDTDA